MPQLETLVIFFSFPVRDHDVARQLTHALTVYNVLPQATDVDQTS